MSFVHNVLMVGPPGAGMTLLARAMPSNPPRMTIEEALDVTRIYSVADQLQPDVPLIRNRPFRIEWTAAEAEVEIASKLVDLSE